MAETKKDALAAFDPFVETWGVKYDKAVECLIKDRDALLAFYDFPAEHWKHLRTTNVIESSFATVRHRGIQYEDGCKNRIRHRDSTHGNPPSLRFRGAFVSRICTVASGGRLIPRHVGTSFADLAAVGR